MENRKTLLRNILQLHYPFQVLNTEIIILISIDIV
ncbi:MAG: hypothetical protein JWR26_3655 [Pedosphaera sp.]|nr:hypothetical protein [Pedosphaera sp.]